MKSLILRKRPPKLLYSQYIISLVCRYSTKQIFSVCISIFCNKSGNAILLATPNLWGNIQIVRTYILKYNVFNLMSLHHFEYIFDKVICHILENVEDVKKIYFTI